MKKKKGKVLIILGILSAAVALLEGWLYYSPETYPHPMFRWMFIVQNMIKAFTFRSDIGLKEMAKLISSSNSLFQTVVAYVYSVAIFTAPYCTAAFLYSILARFFKLKSVKWWFIKERNILIFGYNDEVKALLKGVAKTQRIHIISTEVPQEEELQLLKEGIAVHQVNCMKLSKHQLGWFVLRTKLKTTSDVILFHESSATNFSIYQWFHEEKIQKYLKKNIKFFCRCEDEGIKRLIENYYDEIVRGVKKIKNEIKALDKKTPCTDEEKKQLEDEIQKTKEKLQREQNRLKHDLEIINISELRVKKMLEKHPLHAYYCGEEPEAKAEDPKEVKTIEKWGEQHNYNLHLLIVGFGKIGKQLLLQAMNLGAVSSKNNILIDVVDFDTKNQKNIFANQFDKSYVEMDEENKFVISDKKADGNLTIRFHDVDIRHKQFGELLQDIGNPESSDGSLFTYMAICVKNIDISMLCMSEVERYLTCYTEPNDKNKISVGIRLEGNPQLAKYVQENNTTFQNVFVIEDTDTTIRLKDILHDDLSKEAKAYNYIYQTMDVSVKEFKDTNCTKAEKQQSTPQAKPSVIEKIQQWWADLRKNENLLTPEEEYWYEREMFRRNSSMAIARHADVRKVLLTEDIKKKLIPYFGEQGSILKDVGGSWEYYGSEESFVKLLNNLDEYPWIAEFARLEHRRWCYYVASCGWKSKDTAYWDKSDRNKENSCLCPWNELADMEKIKTEEPKQNKDPKYYACKYDLMPLLKAYLEEKEKQV